MAKFKKSQVEQIVKEELASVMAEWLSEADEKEEKPEGPEVKGADSENDAAEPDKEGNNMAPKVGASADDEPETGDDDIPDEELPAEEDPADTELSQDVEEPEDEEPEGGDISKELVGQSIQSITMTKDSKMMPGATEVVIQFEHAPHPLRILLGKSGMIKFFWKGTLHNEV